MCNDVKRRLVLCNLPGLIQGSVWGADMDAAFLQHVLLCLIVLYVIDRTSKDPIDDFCIINQELEDFDDLL